MTAVLALLGLPTYAAVFILLRAWAIATIWGWILVPVFGIASISVSASVGITALLTLAKGVPPMNEGDVPPWKPIVASVVQIALALLVAWCAKQFI